MYSFSWSIKILKQIIGGIIKMYKITYEYSNLFTLKKYNDSNLNCQSYQHMTIYGIRSAILGQAITQDGIDVAKDIFHKIKNAIIYIQFPENSKANPVFQRRRANSHYNAKRGVIEDNFTVKEDESQTMGFRQYYHVKESVFYIDKSIPNIDRYLKGIDYLGTQASMVWLKSVDKVDEMKNIMMVWNGIDDEYIYENHDWGSKMTFEHVYMFGDSYDKRVKLQKNENYTVVDMVEI